MGQRHAPAALYPGKDLVPIVQEAGWAPGPVWTSAENLSPTGVRSPDRPARSQSLYRLSYPAYNFMTSRWILLRMRDVLDKFVEKMTTLMFCSVTFLFEKPCHLWHIVEQCGTARESTDDNTIRRMRFACQITKGCRHAIRIYNIAFPRQQWLWERASVLRCTYIRVTVVESLPQSHLLMQSYIY